MLRNGIEITVQAFLSYSAFPVKAGTKKLFSVKQKFIYIFFLN